MIAISAHRVGRREAIARRRQAATRSGARKNRPRRLTGARRGTYDSRPEETGTSASQRIGRKGSLVVDLAQAREARRLGEYRERLRAVFDTNKRALSRLFQTGLIYSRQGARLGRDLLLAHQHLLRAGDLLARVSEMRARHDAHAEAETLYGEVQQLLSRTTELTARSDVLLARRR